MPGITPLLTEVGWVVSSELNALLNVDMGVGWSCQLSVRLKTNNPSTLDKGLCDGGRVCRW
jgi:hypothetical protein